MDFIVSLQGQGNYDVTRYENIFSLFWILEQLFQQETQGDPTLHIDHSSPEIQAFLQKHDETIFRLSDAFPLLTFYLWRLGILLTSAEMKTGEETFSQLSTMYQKTVGLNFAKMFLNE